MSNPKKPRPVQQYVKAAARLPGLPSIEAIPQDEVADYEAIVDRLKGFWSWPETVDGVPYGVPHFSALAVSPRLALIVSALGRAISAVEGKEGTYSHTDHEFIDLILPLDSGYYHFLAGHTPHALSRGIRLEAIEALRDGEEHLLTEDETQVVQFIRTVRDGEMTDDIWNRMAARLGTVRGVVEFIYHILLLGFHHRFCWAVGAPEMSADAFDQMLDEFKSGKRVPYFHGSAPTPSN